MLHLIIGNKNYSSWSFRPWIAMKVAGIAFQETVISLEAADFKSRVQAISGAGKVPVLADGDVRVWESLAILEYLAEKFPAAGLWPRDVIARGHARAISAEMHAGFQPMRRQLPMNMWRPVLARQLEPDAKADVARIETIWAECRSRFGAGGRFFMELSERQTPCMPRLSRASIPTPLRSAQSRVTTWLRSWRYRPGRNGVTLRCARFGFCRTTKSIGPRSSASNPQARCELSFQLVQERPLVFDELRHRGRQGEIRNAVDLRKALTPL